MLAAHLRIARPVSDLQRSAALYCAGLGLQQIADFSDHQGFSGIMLGDPQLGWHLEFTVCHHHPLSPTATEEDLLVLWLADSAQWQQRCQNMLTAGFRQVPSFNPYWDVAGATFVDDDGYRVVLQNRAWR
ncbi:VOC family protein [Winslowiella iniecta]|uniref:Prolyl endopeptidase n=2 Tax=Winslowiella iniecta TaxID=1560201 RepID=A0A0L7T5H4_9GAMM|nr:VOC family protein [Winslowiella iniecta]KOC90600.1 prolyl endopeptidase [Winslowiella iniecta]